MCAALLKACPNLHLSISCTTRKPRPGEENGREYHFLDKATFDAQQQHGDFLESAFVHGNFYGTRQSDVEKVLASGWDVLLEIDWQGAAQVAEKIPSSKRIFILPPSIEALRDRLTKRGQDDATIIARRVLAAQIEINHAAEAQHQIVNDDFESALKELKALVMG